MTPAEILSHYWGHSAFRPLQEAAVNSVIEGHDTLVLMPTGGGKSLCYQIPALALDGVAIVVSPLVSLITDQVAQLRRRGVKAAAVHSGMGSYEIDVTLNNAVSGLYKLLYVSPERLKSRLFIERLKRMHVSLIAVDEAHCISQWGYDFRPPYLDIADIRPLHPHAPVVALTATATPQVADDIQRNLRFRQPQIFRTSFARENLAYMVLHETDKTTRLINILSKIQGSSIVYVRSRRVSASLAETLTAHGIQAQCYHAGLSAKERDSRQKAWSKGQIGCMVATNAFGMGIDKPDVRCVAHIDIPPSPEAYFQEAGRAGRDGRKSYAVLLYDDSDLRKLHEQIDTEFPPLTFIRNVYRALGNYYQVPIGSGGDTLYPFDHEKLCSSYGFPAASFFAALRILEREGLIGLPDLSHSLSALHIPVSHEELYSFQLQNPRYSDIIATILRMYGGLFTDFVPISERDIAKRMYIVSYLHVIAALQYLNRCHVVAYRLRSDKPQLIFTRPRVDADTLMISPDNYAVLRRRAEERATVMARYVTADSGCRAALLRSYFGDTGIEPCRICDLCIAGTRTRQSKESTQTRILMALETHGKMTLPQLAAHISDIGSEELNGELHTLLDYNKIALDPITGLLSVNA